MASLLGALLDGVRRDIPDILPLIEAGDPRVVPLIVSPGPGLTWVYLSYPPPPDYSHFGPRQMLADVDAREAVDLVNRWMERIRSEEAPDGHR